MTSTLFQNILPEDIPVMLKRLNAYTKSYQKEEYIKHAGDPAVQEFHIFPWILWQQRTVQ